LVYGRTSRKEIWRLKRKKKCSRALDRSMDGAYPSLLYYLVVLDVLSLQTPYILYHTKTILLQAMPKNASSKSQQIQRRRKSSREGNMYNHIKHKPMNRSIQSTASTPPSHFFSCLRLLTNVRREGNHCPSSQTYQGSK
jgi:hypothetical protein